MSTSIQRILLILTILMTITPAFAANINAAGPVRIRQISPKSYLVFFQHPPSGIGEQSRKLSRVLTQKAKKYGFIYGIEGVSASTNSRPGFLTMMEQEIKTLLCQCHDPAVLALMKGIEDREAFFFNKLLFNDYFSIRDDGGIKTGFPQYYLLVSFVREIPSFRKAWEALRTTDYYAQSQLAQAYDTLIKDSEPPDSLQNKIRFIEIEKVTLRSNWIQLYKNYLLSLTKIVQDPLLPKQQIDEFIKDPNPETFEKLVEPLLVDFREERLIPQMQILLESSKAEGRDTFIAIGEKHRDSLSSKMSGEFNEFLSYEDALEFVEDKYP